MLNKFEIFFLNRLANLYIRFGFPARAIKLLKGAIKRYPSEKELYFSLATSYKRLRKWNDSVNTLRTALTIFPGDLELNWALGTSFLISGKAEEALEYLTFYSQHYHPGDKSVQSVIYALLGSCHLELANWSEAEQYLERSRELVPWNLDACVNIIQLYRLTGRSKKIVELLDCYIADYPNLYPLNLWKGHYFQYILRQPENSLTWYRQGLKMIADPEARKCCETYLFTGDVGSLLDEYTDALFKLGNAEMVLSEIEKYEKYELTTRADNICHRIKYYIRREKFDAAEDIFNKSPKSIRETPEVLAAYANAQFKRGYVDKAENIIARALLIDPELIDSLELLGQIQMHNKLWDEAISTYDLLLKRVPFSTDLLKNLGVCYYNLEQYEKTLECYEACVQYDEYDAEKWVDLGDLFKKLGRNTSAVSAYKTGLKFDWLGDEKREQALQAMDEQGNRI